ncbi:unnamed protein product [Camellia sinensis]
METLTNEALEAPRDLKNFTVLNCIDLSSPNVPNSVSLLKQACLDSGFFYVINHGISQEFMDEVFYQSKSFFDLPVSEKMKVLRNKKHRGDYKEGYYIRMEVPENDPDIEKLFYGPNVWPPSEALEVAKAISRIIALALNLEVDFFDRQEMLGKPITTLRLLHYEGRVSDPMKGIYGAGAHSDFGLITLLATDDVYGLQICKDKDAKPQKWEFVAPLKGAFIVNLGDMLERWSNCIFRSTLHRVLGNGQERYSVRLHTLWSPIMIVLLNACPPASRKRTLPSFLLSNVKLTCSSGTRKLTLLLSHTKIDTPNSVVNITRILASSVEHRALNRLMEDPAAYGKLGLANLLELREDCLREFYFADAYRSIKQRENEASLAVLPDLLMEIDSMNEETRLLTLIEGVLAANIFDWGSRACVDLYHKGTIIEIYRMSRKKMQRPWRVDDFDLFKERMLGSGDKKPPPHKRALLFVDNSGVDVILGMLPLARELLRRGTEVVVLVANSLPVLNDVTAMELPDIVAEAAKSISTEQTKRFTKFRERKGLIDEDVSFEALNQRAVAVVVDPIQSVKGKVVIDAFRLINPQTMMLGQEPRQTTSNLGHLNKPSIQALIHGLNRHYYSIAINYRKNELEEKMLLNLHKKKWTDGLTLQRFDTHSKTNEQTVQMNKNLEVNIVKFNNTPCVLIICFFDTRCSVISNSLAMLKSSHTKADKSRIGYQKQVCRKGIVPDYDLRQRLHRV